MSCVDEELRGGQTLALHVFALLKVTRTDADTFCGHFAKPDAGPIGR